MQRDKKMKIRKLLFSIGLALIVLSSYGRNFKDGPYDHRILSINQGFSFSGSGDGWGTGNEISHLKTFLPILYHRESISSWLINGQSLADGAVEQQTGMDLTLELGFSPFLMKNRMLSITGGWCSSFESSFRWKTCGAQNAGDGSYKTEVSYRIKRSITPGFTIGANYHARVNTKLWLNVRAAIRSYSSGNIVSILSVGIGFDPSKLKQ